ncbi:MAG: hypothetical protein HY554_17760 [Elusimicrobia bacterium]|nr:hypothetical protein [Elusimicrobiota bacterium]
MSERATKRAGRWGAALALGIALGAPAWAHEAVGVPAGSAPEPGGRSADLDGPVGVGKVDILARLIDRKGRQNRCRPEPGARPGDWGSFYFSQDKGRLTARCFDRSTGKHWDLLKEREVTSTREFAVLDVGGTRRWVYEAEIAHADTVEALLRRGAIVTAEDLALAYSRTLLVRERDAIEKIRQRMIPWFDNTSGGGGPF